MGPSRPPDVANPLGYFEDVRFRWIHRYWSRRYETRPARARLRLPPWDCTPGKTDLARYARLIAACEQRPHWGVKDPELCYFAPHFAASVHHPLRVIATARNLDAAMASLGASRRYFSAAEIAMIIREYARRQARALEELAALGVPAPLLVDYDWAVDNPEEAVRQVAEHVSLPVTAPAASFIAPKFRRHVQPKPADTPRNDQGVTTLTT